MNCQVDRRRVRSSYGRLRSGGSDGRRQGSGRVSAVFVNPLRGRGGAAARSNDSSTSSSPAARGQRQLQPHQLLQLHVVDSPYDAVLIDNEDVAL